MTVSGLKDRVALVTGSATGIGFAIARRLATEGARVVMVDVSDSVSTAAAEKDLLGRGIPWVGDVTDPEFVRSVIVATEQASGSVDILVNNAWRGSGEAAVDTPLGAWQQTIDGTLTSAFVCMRAALPGMIERHFGVVLNIASVNAARFSGHDAYSAAKAGMLSLTRSIAARHGRDGIRANAIIPGTIITGSWDTRTSADPHLPDRLLEFYPLGRLGTPDDVASACAFLASDEASWITGAELPVDGGYLVANSALTDLTEGRSRET